MRTKSSSAAKRANSSSLGRLASSTLSKRAVDQGAVLVGAEVVAPDADDAAALGQGAMAERLEQGRHEFAPGQIASAAEQNEIKGHVMRVT